MAKGIANVSGVSCHVASALQLLFHGITESKICLAHLAELSDTTMTTTSKESLFLRELGKLFRDLQEDSSSTTCSTAVDPTFLYKSLEALTHIDPYELGDAVTAVRVVLQTIRRCLIALQPSGVDDDKRCDRSSPSFPWKKLDSILQKSIFGGTLCQELTGTGLPGGHLNEDSSTTMQRRKSNIKTMTCPFTISTVSCPSLPAALAKATTEPSPILGYDWDHAQDYVEETIDSTTTYPQRGANTVWQTNKTSRLVSLPEHLLLQLQRFVYRDGYVQVLTDEIDVPDELNMAIYMHCDEDMMYHSLRPCCLQYRLVGAILHTNDEPSRAVDDSEKGGHYMTLFRNLLRDSPDSQWTLLDDENVRLLTDTPSEVFDFLSCRPSTVLCDKGPCAATLLAYRRICECNDSRVQVDVSEFKESFNFHKSSTRDHSAFEADWTKPHDLVGRKLGVRWAKGKFYTGIVASFNKATGKHCVLYDDGDTREYNLRKKTVKWEESLET